MLRFLILCIALFALVVPQQSRAEEDDIIKVNVANDHVDITTGFDGAPLVIYGVTAVEGDIAILVTGPRRTMIVRRKSPVVGAWINTSLAEFGQVPAFYDYALSRFEIEKDAAEEMHKNGIGLDGLDFALREQEGADSATPFREAMIRNKQTQGLFPLKPKTMEFIRGDFFKTEFFLPSNVPTGDYTVSAYLFRNGKLYAQDQDTFRVAQVGFSARVFAFAYRDSLAYGLVAVMMALFAGWAAFTFLRRD
jgi:uncharacterized protein (TIGR02186 family)